MRSSRASVDAERSPIVRGSRGSVGADDRDVRGFCVSVGADDPDARGFCVSVGVRGSRGSVAAARDRARGSRMSVAWLVGQLAVVGSPACGSEAPAPASAEISPPPAASPPVTEPPLAPPVVSTASPGRLAEDCGTLAAAAPGSPEDAALLLWMCPEVQATRAALRAALLLVDSPAGAAELAPRLRDAPDLAGLARLVALDRAAAPLPPEAPDPLTAAVSPVDDAVLAAVTRAIGMQTAAGLTHEQRTRAMAYLARAHHEATAQLGLPAGQPLPPFARLLAGRFLHFGRSFCQMYWQRRVAGLEVLFATTEAQLLRVVLALEASPHAGDDALLAVERQRARRYLQGPGVAERLKAKGVTESPAELLPLPHEFERLADHGFVELAIQRALFLGGEQPQGFGLAPMIELLSGLLAERDLGEYRALLDRRIGEARALQPAPPESGALKLPGRRPLGWTPPAAVAEAAEAWLSAAAGASGFARRYGMGRAALLLRDRPDAVRELLRRALLGPTPSRRPPAFVGVALDLLGRVESDSLLWLRLQAAAFGATGDVGVRRAFALASRDAGLLPR